MLVLTRNIGESILIETPAGDVTVTLLYTGNRKAKIGIWAPKEVLILRSELKPMEQTNDSEQTG